MDEQMSFKSFDKCDMRRYSYKFILLTIAFIMIISPSTATWYNSSYENRTVFDVTAQNPIINISTQTNTSDIWINHTDNKLISFWNESKSNKVWLNLTNGSICISYPCTLQIDKYSNRSGQMPSYGNITAVFNYSLTLLTVNSATYSNISTQTFSSPYMLEFNATVNSYSDQAGIGFCNSGANCFNGVGFEFLFFSGVSGYIKEFDGTGYLTPDFGNLGTGNEVKYKLFWGSGATQKASYNETNYATSANALASPRNVGVGTSGTYGGSIFIDYLMAYSPLGSSTISVNAYQSLATFTSWNNNYTNDNSLSFTKITNSNTVNFSVSSTNTSYYNWSLNGVDQGVNLSYFNKQFQANGTYYLNATITAFGLNNVSLNWTITARNYTIELVSPANQSTGISTPTTLLWREWPNGGLAHNYYVSTDALFLNIIASGIAMPTIENYTVSLNLNNNILYYWKVKNGTGVYSSTFEFTTSSAPVVPGYLNITAFDEQYWNSRIMVFSAQIYNSTTTLNKSTTTGWVNFSSGEVSAGQYLVRIVPNSSYASRSVLATSPTNVSLWLPLTATNTIDTIAFYLLDYTNKYPWEISTLTVTKNNSIMHSAYFDSDAKVAVYLIRGDSYGITVTNPSTNTVQNWGNYISTGSGNVEVVIMNIGVNTTVSNPFSYKVSWTSANITLQWNDTNNVMSSINYSIYKGVGRTLVHQIITSVDAGSSEYIVTNTSDVYFAYVSALTTGGWRNQSYVIDYRSGTSASESESSRLYTWSYGSVTIPAWVKNAFAVIALMILAGSFGALHRSEGGIITSIMSLFFWKWGWLSAYGAGAGFLGGLLLFAIIYALDSKRKGAGYY